MTTATAQLQVEFGAADFTLANLRRGSEVLNQKKADIDFLFKTVLGAFRLSDCEGYRQRYMFVRFETSRPVPAKGGAFEIDNLDWHGFLIGEEFEMYIWDGNDLVYSRELGAASIPMSYVEEIHDGADVFLAHVASNYPTVVERCRPLLLAAAQTR
ncbi:MAG: hypothetical protein A3C85_01470 [Candidatus Doudnabacteria bacterium RIFCSPHIGHO2_02_FULL_48_21]|uniref:Uncharacterized protein n=1 Tax=Candidatus Doudnabacteria bacterium RIFCSPLOWO2_02_FULL_48_13 TaxID=1817845 RepID=A0A1F5Q9C7_9BACT|nr:MAG: hypothetical protein A3K05_03090 [Candidatus Doudnabacteria bacterium RIFCSPHIGHO2_01_48_18]OGE79921.1 MAG: hypothetical protein A2668_01475 [Candidatus Doudnabacteria bacterium RIFCSPHIGHO2_01_FULL_48_180]OGE93953.1 MAG: hypothetical protein A3C85_01470 [Candidatus Doudnabacteria bacterium RIFCSPHIGHO2_02_FULL_48_21]OGE97209.1 MAG: hypothetical protein A3A83_03860 [Candidatus Doudnabacteria bacterium RIFCSPLOWO2_01_FULL_48_57]OGE98502.1 MAG: hypothetical protein A3J05_03325 [Candidatus